MEDWAQRNTNIEQLMKKVDLNRRNYDGQLPSKQAFVQSENKEE